MEPFVANIRIATRSSRLALWQAEYVARRIQEASGHSTELVEVSTEGDRNRRDSLAQFGGMGVFTREVQNVVLQGEADVAVHSLKDLPTETAEGLTLGAFPVRAARFDLLVFPAQEGAGRLTLESLARGARVGTGSPRRRAQLLKSRPDLDVRDIRGNLDTRLRKLDEGEYDAIVLAEAGMARLGLEGRPFARMDPPEFYPAVGQGILGIECRDDDEVTLQALAAIDDPAVRAEALAERAALRTLRAGCHAPVGVSSRRDGETLNLTVVVFAQDGSRQIEASDSDVLSGSEALGGRVAEEVIRNGGAEMLAAR